MHPFSEPHSSSSTAVRVATSAICTLCPGVVAKPASGTEQRPVGFSCAPQTEAPGRINKMASTMDFIGNWSLCHDLVVSRNLEERRVRLAAVKFSNFIDRSITVLVQDDDLQVGRNPRFFHTSNFGGASVVVGD